jgi:2-amino-4-hydroxy-6-hydroxymethyldihydropteridine diphosphokinase
VNVVVGVGGSGALAEHTVLRAIEALDDHPQWRLRARSRLFANPAVGGRTHARFVNAAVVLDSALSLPALVLALHALEARFGRVRADKDAARSLDLDVLHADGLVHATSWPAVPHPRAAERPFAFGPGLEALERAGLPAPIAWLAARARTLAPEVVAVDDAKILLR